MLVIKRALRDLIANFGYRYRIAVSLLEETAEQDLREVASLDGGASRQ